MYLAILCYQYIVTCLPYRYIQLPFPGYILFVLFWLGKELSPKPPTFSICNFWDNRRFTMIRSNTESLVHQFPSTVTFCKTIVWYYNEDIDTDTIYVSYSGFPSFSVYVCVLSSIQFYHPYRFIIHHHCQETEHRSYTRSPHCCPFIVTTFPSFPWPHQTYKLWLICP